MAGVRIAVRQVKQQREHDQRARARQRDHDVVENRIQEAFINGSFDNLAGAGVRRE